MFLHFPGFLPAVRQVAALWHVVPPILVVHGPADTMPARCKKPGKPVSLEHVPA